jgi:hypothetical protein
MPQRNSHRYVTRAIRPPTDVDMLPFGGLLLLTLVLVLLITNGGAG